MSKPIKPLDELEAGWMQDIAAGAILSVPQTDGLRSDAVTDPALKQTRPLSIRIAKGDLEAIQVQAEREGLPYQTYIKSVLHKLATGQLEPRSAS